VPWDQRLFDPIELPGGRKLITLRDAARYITKLPKVERVDRRLAAVLAADIVGYISLDGAYTCQPSFVRS
jgi:hypothetical protein